MPPRDRLDRLHERTRIDPILARTIKVDSVEDSVRKAMETSVRSRLNIGDQLPADVTEAIKSTAASAAATAVELTVADAAQQAAKDVGRTGIKQRFDSKIAVAAESLAHISASSEVDQVLKKRSELLAKKRDSLVAAGFSNEEAMQIVLADIAARAH